MVFDRIDKIKDYFRGIELTNGVRIVNVTYPPKWGVYPSDDETIKVAKSEDKVNEWFYYGDCELVTFSDMFDLIDNTIEMNVSAEAKLELLNEKFDELKHLFATEQLEKLQTLTFVFNEPKKTKKRKTKKKIEENNTIEQVVVEENNDNDEKINNETNIDGNE